MKMNVDRTKQIINILYREISDNEICFNDVIYKVINKHQELDETDVRSTLLNMLSDKKVDLTKDYRLRVTKK